MQSTKDTFFLSVRSRLQALNPDRTITVNGETVPGLLVDENRAGSADHPPDVFFLSWGNVRSFSESPLLNTTLLAVECAIRYGTEGGVNADVGRGRELARLDHELLLICLPARAPKMDYSAGSPRELGSAIFWQLPVLGPIERSANRVSRSATLLVFFYPEGELQ